MNCHAPVVVAGHNEDDKRVPGLSAWKIPDTAEIPRSEVFHQPRREGGPECV